MVPRLRGAPVFGLLRRAPRCGRSHPLSVRRDVRAGFSHPLRDRVCGRTDRHRQPHAGIGATGWRIVRRLARRVFGVSSATSGPVDRRSGRRATAGPWSRHRGRLDDDRRGSPDTAGRPSRPLAGADPVRVVWPAPGRMFPNGIPVRQATSFLLHPGRRRVTYRSCRRSDQGPLVPQDGDQFDARTSSSGSGRATHPCPERSDQAAYRTSLFHVKHRAFDAGRGTARPSTG